MCYYEPECPGFNPQTNFLYFVLILINGRIFCDVIVYILLHEHTHSPGEMILRDKNCIQKKKKKELHSEPKMLSKLTYQKICSFLRSVFENILAFRNIQNSWVAKLLKSNTFVVKILVFKHASHKIHLIY